MKLNYQIGLTLFLLLGCTPLSPGSLLRAENGSDSGSATRQSFAERGEQGESENEGPEGEEGGSGFSSKSHNSGQNCMKCHSAGQPAGEHAFFAAGTVYDQAGAAVKTGGRIQLRTQPNGGGTLVLEMPVDATGNFYTAKALDLKQDLYPSVSNGAGKTQFMSSPLSSGQCNSCHGVTQSKIWSE
ncbi:hypothetical protein COW36_10445 [bacterium (Candidatus Blackallbacteria) CG17_big_fil_post_rev_8_21_14_2_50_48_46]|uniref:Uncharacterized protein n=1 Tax=bacterium (Candidatus Blackallbacteria) CG17_big_fil_post_rev_8_21_14_2_50_48_46 TaxID=2014261 RepID=A0A2M7G570_9BACT|nr:MAG: hypothetical protein COW64_20220 [bacterium (Candidatus Blackallbacteria) CG18_big_fil_WC_8_21_14_2_50_49_26]PIW17051.1 MAG: hypothetical protein COW36_10445 [bacterium (Candidatus Blackallbacteria) CG17_big_fil_post_rev_8_21_14_2_50_48_46]PIW47714.1 MAG: hypothetical protein COW20_11775 [bacterium (Candidatus Blackallbacteria) CG13_big_fil_rev_8_21_14_2_50_49_14]